jgi:hypothetical protein
VIRQIAIAENEIDLVGQWVHKGRKLVADPIAERIEELVSEHLVLLSARVSGWDELYRDPATGQLWELTWPQSELQGGGPPRLTRISTADARGKYGALADG